MAVTFQNLSDNHKDLYFIQGKNRAKYPFSNSLILNDYIIDTGISGKYVRKIKRDYQINHVILSHWHEDHISGNHFLPKAKFYCHILDKPVIENIEKMISFYNIEHETIGEDLTNLLNLLGMENTLIEKTINDEEIMSIGDNMRLKVIHTPGHTAGHCSFLELDSKIGFLGDIDLTKHPFYGNIDASLLDFENSIQKLLSLNFDIVITGHREPIIGKNTIKDELKKYQSILHKREERILGAFSEQTKPIYPTDLKSRNLIYKNYSMYKDFEIIAELIMIKKHFDKLETKNIISFEGKGYILN